MTNWRRVKRRGSSSNHAFSGARLVLRIFFEFFRHLWPSNNSHDVRSGWTISWQKGTRKMWRWLFNIDMWVCGERVWIWTSCNVSSNLDFPKLRGFPFLSCLLRWARGRNEYDWICQPYVSDPWLAISGSFALSTIYRYSIRPQGLAANAPEKW